MFKSFLGWRGANFDRTGTLVAAFELENHKPYRDGEIRSPANDELKTQNRYNKESLDSVIETGEWSAENLALLKQAQRSYPDASGPRGRG